MNVLDIILLCLLVLTALIGCFKGFISTLLSFVGGTLSFVGAFFLAKPFAGLLNSWFNASSGFAGLLSGKIGEFFTEFAGELTGTEILTNNCSASGILKTAFKLLVNPEATYTYESIISSISSSAGNFILMAICLIITFVTIKVVIALIAKAFDSAKKNNKALNGTDKFIGLLFGAAKGFLIIAIVCVIANLLQTIPAVANALNTVFNGSSIAKPIYDFVTNLASKYLYNIDFSTLLIK